MAILIDQLIIKRIYNFDKTYRQGPIEIELITKFYHIGIGTTKPRNSEIKINCY